jgi:hypothetical protein
VIFIGEVADTFTWRIKPVSFSNQIVIFPSPDESAEVAFMVKFSMTVVALLGVGDMKSNVGAVVSTVNVLRVVFTLPAVSVDETFK